MTRHPSRGRAQTKMHARPAYPANVGEQARPWPLGATGAAARGTWRDGCASGTLRGDGVHGCCRTLLESRAARTAKQAENRLAVLGTAAGPNPVSMAETTARREAMHSCHFPKNNGQIICSTTGRTRLARCLATQKRHGSAVGLQLTSQFDLHPRKLFISSSSWRISSTARTTPSTASDISCGTPKMS